MAGIAMPGKMADASLRCSRPTSSSRWMMVTCNEHNILVVSHILSMKNITYHPSGWEKPPDSSSASAVCTSFVSVVDIHALYLFSPSFSLVNAEIRASLRSSYASALG